MDNIVEIRITLLSTASSRYQATSPQPLEIPTNVALYLRYATMYITGTIFAASVVATVYILLARGHIEGRNMFKLNRVAGIVYMGRPLLLLRSMAAMSVLSTATLELEQSSSGVLTYFIATSTRPLTVVGAVKMFLAAGEVSWFTFVLNDMFMVVTRQYTSPYAFKSSLIVWMASGVLSFASPVYYLDKASAALNGMLVVQVRDTFYVLDVKSWRRFTIDVPGELRLSHTDPRAKELNVALPLTL
ncbi:hypothetical protein DYB35_002421 [Aphanomyces astaci]|uniref:Uncharacterized protein n=1 Tax=Aphanomyces astaci TaxID=112090 RepID=A0A3R7ALB0_APHAT|nr:hypothetical protein DYB35_002421 [Aphanomyces astaci]